MVVTETMFSSSHCAIAFFFSTICLEGSADGAVTAGVDDSQPRLKAADSQFSKAIRE
ncbi:hypothetical protein PYR71_29015 [Rhizobium sp. MC63]|uniref:hypothetical protein n=1 Tax=Rhizobium mulingense TaxID=3031128 RepID=UPI0023D85B23|nr:hypothetical protein [Rhizobium sp. MC63]MDF0700445.1 hypothetical protein [Rhizobium sp. MC63]